MIEAPIDKRLIEEYKRSLLREGQERIKSERKRIEHALEKLGHDPKACLMVETAIDWLLLQPIE